MNTRSTLIGIGLGISAIACAVQFKPSIELVFNPSDSAPRGWYWIHPATEIVVGDYVVTALPEEGAKLAERRGYLPRSVPLLKQVAAGKGTHVCSVAGEILIDHRFVATALLVDRLGRAMPVWSQCRLLQSGEVFVLNAAQPWSFDSRYFGPIERSMIYGRALPLWTWTRS